MKIAMNHLGLAVLLAFTMALGGLCGCATKMLPKISADSPTDQKVALAVQKGLADDTLFEYPDVEIKVKDGLVELNGSVSKWEAVDQAATIAKYTKGVQMVKNNLTVKQ